MLQTVITVRRSALALEHPPGLTYLSSHHPPYYSLASRKVQDSSSEARELQGVPESPAKRWESIVSSSVFYS